MTAATSNAAAPIDAVLFDFAGTLFSDRELRDVHLEQLRFVAAECASPVTDDRELRAAYRSGMGRAARAVMVRPFYSHRELFALTFREMAEELGGAIGPEVAQTAVDRQYRATVEHATLRPDARATIEVLRSCGVHVGVVSNIDDEQLQPMVRRLGLDTLLDAWTSSDEARSCKPDPAIYALALAKAGRPAAAALFVGDSVGHDVLGPAALGMRTAWLVVDAKLHGDREHAADHEIDALAAVVAIVEGSRA
jgi:HAD superfamily hydrolase (TIGR01509 family)